MTTADTERQAMRSELSEDAAALNLMEFWEERAELELLQPRQGAEPCLWRWKDIEPRLHRAAEIVPLEEAERRALLFSNPGLAPRPFMTNTIFGAYSLYNPGEHAPVHRHTPSASRMLLEGEGAYTTVEGEKCVMHRGDLILTPNGTWHDHGNDGDGPIIWMDVLDLPLVENLNSTVFEFEYFEEDAQSNTREPVQRTTQSVIHPDDHSQNLYAGGGYKPLFVDRERGVRGDHSPMFVYRAENTREQLDRLRDYDGSPFDGVIIEFCDPTTGGPVMPTLSYTAQLLRPGEHTRAHRHTANAIYCVVEGSGYTQIGDTRLDWTRNDAFCAPAWMWHEHVNTSPTGDAVLYSVTDTPTLKKLGLYREERRMDDGEQVLAVR
jgi:gentisate 1,2-dioxygenase